MKRFIHLPLSIFALALVALTATPTAHAQDSTSNSLVADAQYQPPPPPPPPPGSYGPHYAQPRYPRTRVNLGVGITRQLTQTMTDDGPSRVTSTDSTGLLVSLRSVPFWGTGAEVNYQYTQLTEHYVRPVTPGVFVGTNAASSFHELTGAFLWEEHVRGVKPFMSIGGGAIDFVPLGNTSHNQWRGAGLMEVGFDIPASHYWGVRVEGRSLFYRAPNFNNSALQARAWVATVNPSVSLYARW